MDRLLTTTGILITLAVAVVIELSVTACGAESTAATTTTWKVSSYVMRSIHARGSRYHYRRHKLHFGCNADHSNCNTMPGLTAATNASTCCNGFCKDIQFDSFNCGGCNSGCVYRSSCCSSKCVDLYADDNNCGQCGIVCSAGPCTFGLCSY